VNRAALPLLLLLVLAGACSSRPPRVSRPPQPPPAPPTFPAPPPTASAKPIRVLGEGLASWYGVPYHGRRAANGEIYDMYKLTAAHLTLPFETIVRVTNLNNGKQTDVRITDRGPFVEDRIIDLSLAAARAIDMVAAGVVPVRLEFISGPDTAGSFTVQVGAFEQRANALRLRQQLERRYQPVFLLEYDSPRGLLYRVRVGRVGSEAAAERLAARLREREQLKTMVVRLDEEN
jgi:rare lipoprotein A